MFSERQPVDRACLHELESFMRANGPDRTHGDVDRRRRAGHEEIQLEPLRHPEVHGVTAPNDLEHHARRRKLDGSRVNAALAVTEQCPAACRQP